MNRKLTKLLALVLALSLVACLFAGCSKDEAAKNVKIGVLVADVSGEEALGFRSYYENYIAKQYPNVSFVYTEQLADAAAEKSAIEKFAAQGCQAILSFSSSDRAVQLDTCVPALPASESPVQPNVAAGRVVSARTTSEVAAGL